MKKSAFSVSWFFTLLFFAAGSLFADGSYFKKYYPAPAAPAPREFVYGALWQIWIPPQVETLRGIVLHQHGCSEGSWGASQTAIDDLHWQALARKYDCALIVPTFEQTGKCELWCDPRNGSADSFFTALDDFAEMTGHGELNRVPWALWGHSGGAQWCGSLCHLYPERIVGAFLRSGHTNTVSMTTDELPDTPEFRRTPILFNIGTAEREGPLSLIWKDGFPLVARFRAQGALVGYMIDPHTDHETGDSRYPAIRFLDECLAARLPETPGSSELRPAPKGVILSADEENDAAVRPFLKDGFWLPSEGFAEVWRRYEQDCSFDDETPPPAPYKVSLTEEGLLAWELTADPESGFAGVSVQWNGSEWKIPEENRNPFGRNLYQGLRYSDTPNDPVPPLEFQIPDYRAGIGPVTVTVYNTCGLASEPVTADVSDPPRADAE
ncbi:MAG: hypothetical protein IJG60_07430 [Thermoguttaceae bacterium]|nr:hypothetical protein [Thermoguttaceae bacterium]